MLRCLSIFHWHVHRFNRLSLLLLLQDKYSSPHILYPHQCSFFNILWRKLGHLRIFSASGRAFIIDCKMWVMEFYILKLGWYVIVRILKIAIHFSWQSFWITIPTCFVLNNFSLKSISYNFVIKCERTWRKKSETIE